VSYMREGKDTMENNLYYVDVGLIFRFFVLRCGILVLVSRNLHPNLS
jgi:hypothetical protein